LARRWKKHLCPFFATLSVANKYNLTSIKPGTSLLQSLAFFTEELKRFSGITVPASTSRRFALISDASLEGLGAILCEVSRNNITSGFALNPSRVWWFNLFHTDDPTSWQRVTQFCTAGDRGQVESKDINVLEMLAATKAIHAVQTILADEDEHNTVGYVQLHMFLDNLSMVSFSSQNHMTSLTQTRLLQLLQREPPEGSAEAALCNKRFRDLSIKASTRASYSTPVRWYRLVATFPVTGSKLETYIRLLTSSGTLKSSTIRSYTSAVRTFAVNDGQAPLPPEEEARVARALSAADHMVPNKHPPKRAPLVPLVVLDNLRRLKTTPGTSHDAIRCICLLAYSLTLRLSEVLHLCGSHISVEEAIGQSVHVRLTLEESKTHRLSYRELACDGTTCGLWCAAHWLARIKPQIPDGIPLFAGWTAQRVMQQFVALVQAEFPTCTSATVLTSLTGHSFRRTATNVAHELGLSVDALRTAGGWAPTSSTWRIYAEEELIKTSRTFATQLLQHLPRSD
ncbi:hypothetical protein FOZ62_000869, partial [Perkinsus olseni]